MEEQALAKFTVFVQQPNGYGTTHISSHEATNSDGAVEAALRETANDWGYESTCNLRVLGVASGDITILEWNDLE